MDSTHLHSSAYSGFRLGRLSLSCFLVLLALFSSIRGLADESLRSVANRLPPAWWVSLSIGSFFFVYGLSGLCASLTGIYLVSRLGIGNPTGDTNFNLASITPVILGGTPLTGGRGGVLGTLLGVLLVQTLNNVLNFLDVSTFYQWMIQGLIVIAAVSIFVEKRRRVA
jgi:hypothetical protein